ncbi:MAG: acetyltransferase [Myxococcota bacterium]
MNPPGKLVVLGAGGHAKVVIATVRAAGGEVVDVYDDDSSRWGQNLLGVAVRGPIADAVGAELPAIIAIGNNGARRSIAEALSLTWAPVCHPSAVVDTSVVVGPGAVVFAGAVIQPDTVVGEHAIVNTGSSIDHDCSVGAFVHLGPGVRLCGGVSVGEGTLLGVGSNVAPNVAIGSWATVGAGAVCVADVPGQTTVVGVPARGVGAKP